MEHNLFKKGLVAAIIILFVGVTFVPSISRNSLKINCLNDRKTEENSKYINSYNTPDDAFDHLATEDCVYVITDEFGLYEYTCLNPDSNYEKDEDYVDLGVT